MGWLFVLILSLVIMPVSADEFKITQIGDRFVHGWGMDFINPEVLIVTERGGAVSTINIHTAERHSVSDVPAVFAHRQGGMLDVAAVPGAAGEQTIVYLCYARPDSGGARTSVMRARLDSNRLTDKEVIFSSNKVSASPIHFGCRLLIDDERLYITLGERGERDDAQDPASHSGAVAALGLDGRPLADAPAQPGWAAALFTKGHRNPQGIAKHPVTGAVWVHEHGPKGGDEINQLVRGNNYGWPVVSKGREYSGFRVGRGLTSAPGYADPLWHWTPSIAPSGMLFYQGKMFPELNGKLLVGALKFKSIYAVSLKDNLPDSEEIFLRNEVGRIRDLIMADDGSLLVLSDAAEGGLYRIHR